MWGYGPGMMGYGYGGYGPGWMMLFGGVFWIVLIVLAIAAVVWIVRSLRHGGPYSPHLRRSAGPDILEERYSRGEINRDEYLQKKRDILG